MIMTDISNPNRLKAELHDSTLGQRAFACIASAIAVCAAGLVYAQQPEAKPGSATNAVTAATSAVQTNTSAVRMTDTNMVMMNFHGTPLDEVLVQLSETAGFTINIKPGTTIRGKVDLFSGKPMTKEAALEWLDRVLNQNGLGAIRNGTELTIVDKAEMKTQNIPVIQGSDPDKIPMTDRIVTQIMPVRFVEAAQLVKDLQPLVSLQTTMSANEAGNSIMMTDTQANIHKVAEIIRAIDMGAEDFVEVRVLHLTNSSPVEMAELLSNLFPDDSKAGNSSGTQSPFAGRLGRFFGGGGGGFPGFGGGTPGGSSGSGGNSANSQNQRIKKRNRVIAVPDQRTTSIIVSANRDLMEQIADVVGELDADAHGKPTVTVFKPQNVDVQEALTVLQDVFPSTSTGNNRNNQNQNNALQNRMNTQSGSTMGGQNSSSSRTGTSGGTRGGGGTVGFGP